MSFLSKITALIPFGKKEEILEYFFALNISSERMICSLWTIEDNQLKILDTASDNYTSLDQLTEKVDKLLDETLGIREMEPQKILFGVPSSWLIDENLKEEYMKVLRDLVKELELQPMAYVENSHALAHFLEKTDGIPPTAILVGFETHHLIVTVVRAGKIDGVKIVQRGEDSGADIEKTLVSFTDVETLPSKILIYGTDVSKLKDRLLSFSWMSKLSFLHFPKIEVLPDDLEIKSVCFAGASEIDASVVYKEHPISQAAVKSSFVTKDMDKKGAETDIKSVLTEDLGFMVGDIGAQEEEMETEELVVPQENPMTELEDFEHELPAPPPGKLLPRKSRNIALLTGIVGILVIILGAYLFLPKAEVKVFVEPKILEKDAQVIADPNQKTVDEESKIIPGQIVETEVSGTAKGNATGQKQVGDPAKGTIIIYNKTFDSKSLSRGTLVSSSNGFKFTLDIAVNVASQSATDSGITFGKANATVTASVVGADSNLPSGSELTIASFSSSQVSAKAEGNFAGGTSKQVTVVSSDDQNKLLASLTSNLRQQAQQKLQEKLPQKKILQEALSEEIIKKSFNKNINDQASEFSLNLTANYKGTAFDDKDLRLIVAKLVTTQVPEGFQLNLEDTETQADVSKVEKGGKVIFLARFKAKLLPKIDLDKVRNQIKGKSASEAVNTLKGMDNVLGAEIKMFPSLPTFLQRLPFVGKNIKIEVGLK